MVAVRMYSQRAHHNYNVGFRPLDQTFEVRAQPRTVVRVLKLPQNSGSAANDTGLIGNGNVHRPTDQRSQTISRIASERLRTK